MATVRKPYATAAPYPALSGSEPCATSDPESFFPLKGSPTKPAKELCHGCDVIRECLAYALTHAVHGVWGGTSEDNRELLRREYDLGRPLPVRYTDPSLVTTTPTGDLP